MLTSNMHGQRPTPYCHITGEGLMVDIWGDPLDSWVMFVNGEAIRGHIHADGTHHQFPAN